jgi:hypothetical protein
MRGSFNAEDLPAVRVFEPEIPRPPAPGLQAPPFTVVPPSIRKIAAEI